MIRNALIETQLFAKDFQAGGLSFVNYTNMDEPTHRTILSMRNLDAIRSCMESQQTIAWEDHKRFVALLAANPNKHYWAVFQAQELVGTIHIEIVSEAEAERGIYVAPAKWGRNVGMQIETAWEEKAVKCGILVLHAKVLLSNERSLWFHHKSGYQLTSRDDRFYYLSKKLCWQP